MSIFALRATFQDLSKPRRSSSSEGRAPKGPAVSQTRFLARDSSEISPNERVVINDLQNESEYRKDDLNSGETGPKRIVASNAIRAELQIAC